MRRTTQPLRRSTHKLLEYTRVFALIAAAIVATNAQDKPDRGFQPANSYSISDLENVNLTNGNLMLNIPLASVPGRGTAPGVTVSARYDSKLWNSTTYTEVDGQSISDYEGGSTAYARSILQRTGDDGYESGGWFIDSGGYRLSSLNRSYLTGEPDCQVLGQGVGSYEWGKSAYVFKLEMHMPDGRIVEFRPYGTGTAYADTYGLGYYSINANGARLLTSYTGYGDGSADCSQSWTQVTTSGMNYYSSDGSGTRLFVPYNANDHWTLYLPNGSKIENLPTDDTSLSQRLTDRNGNHMYWKPATMNSHSGSEIVNDVGQYVFLYGDSSGNTVIQQPGVSGNLLSTTLHWTTTYVNREYQSAAEANANYGHLYDTVEAAISNLDTITLPSQLGSNQYTFTYHGSTTYQTGTSYTEGFGELKTITLPTGASAQYSFDLDSSTKVPLATGNMSNYYTNTDGAAVENFVKQRDLTYSLDYDGSSSSTTETTHYAIDSMTGPDGSVTTQVEGGLGTTFVAKVTHPDGSVTENIWANNAAPKVSATSNIWHIQGTNAYIKTQFTSIPNSSGTLTYTAIKDYDYDKNGNVLAVREYDWVPYGDVARSGSNPTGAIPSGATLVRQTVNTYYNSTPIATDTTTDSSNHYANPSSPKLHNVIASTEIQDGSGTPKARTEFYYDDASNTGNLTETRVWDSTKGSYSNPLTTSNYISTSATYNSYGEPVTTTDANGNVTQITYGSVTSPGGTVTGLYPTQTVTAYGTSVARTMQAAYDFYTGVVTTATDYDNGVSTVSEYDDLGRPTKVRSAYGTSLESWVQTTYNDSSRYIVVKSDVASEGDGGKVSTQFFDQLGRIRLTKTLEDASSQSATNETDGIKVQTRYQYATGYVYKLSSNPYRASTSSGASSEETMGWTRSKAWATGHESQVETFSGSSMPAPWGSNTSSTGVVETDIDTNTTTVTDQAGKVRRSATDGLGRLVRVDEPTTSGLGTLTSPNQWTGYTYDVMNNLTGVSQGSQSRSFSYSSLSRLTSATNPESGTISYGYDYDGNLTSKTDARSITTSYTYDALSRVTQRSYNDSVTPTVTYTYDNKTNAYGKLTKVSNSNSATEYTSFDVLGRVTGHKQTIASHDYTTAYTYNLAGELLTETYPSGRMVSNTFAANADLSQVQSKPSGGSYSNRASSFVYNPAGAVQSMQLGNSKYETTAFNSRLQPTQIGLGTSTTDTSLLKLEYGYGTTANNGNVQSQTITVPSVSYTFSQTYTYDELNRLASATETYNSSQNWNQVFSYDRYGNRSFVTGSGYTDTLAGCTTMCNPSFSSTTNQITSTGYSFDSSGNMTADPSARTFTYDAENKQTQVVDSSTSTTLGAYYYDGDGKRVKKTPASDSTIFVYDAGGKLIEEYPTNSGGGRGFGNVTPTPNVSYVYAGSRLLSTETSSGTNYLTADHLGSPRINTDGSGNVTARHDYMPFGEEIYTSQRTSGVGYASDTVRKQFTDYEQDDETGLDFAQARMMASAVGRFTSPDPLKQSASAGDAQSWNRYSYVRNNPELRTDPTGLIWGYYDEDGKRHFHWFDGKAGKFEGHTYSTYKGPLTLENTNAGTVRLLDGGGFKVLKPLPRSTASTSPQQQARTNTSSPSGGYVNHSLINSIAEHGSTDEKIMFAAEGAGAGIGSCVALCPAAAATLLTAGGTAGADYVATHPEETEEGIEALENLMNSASGWEELSNKTQGFTQGNAQQVFDQITQGGQTISQTASQTSVQLSDGRIVTLYNSSTNALPTIQVNTQGALTVIRFTP